jgi:hypothetical protein
MTTPPYYYPPMQIISSITRGNPTIITTVNDHGYLSSLVVRIVIPSASRATPFQTPQASLGMPQIDGKIGQITVLSPNSFSFPINSLNFLPYTVPAMIDDDNWVGQVIPIAQNALALTEDEFTSTTINNNIIIPEIYPPAPYPAYP